MKFRRNIVIAAMSLAVMGAGYTGVAVASDGGASPSHSESSTQDDKTEGPADQARQDAACDAAGVPLTATNINYDDETGVCTLGSGDDQDDDGQE